MDETARMPRHIAIVMDGNGRWAKKRGLPRTAGHKMGVKAFQKITKYANAIGIEALSVYAFSTENWNRPEDEVAGLMDIFCAYLKDTDSFKKDNIKLTFSGDRSRLSPKLQELMAKAEADSMDFTGLVVNMAINYGGRDELTRAARIIAKKAASGALAPAEVTENVLASFLDTASLPPVDLFIRSGGEVRISNFMLWQLAYAEMVFTDTLWPDFKAKDLDAAIGVYQERDRRFGKVKN